MGTGSQMRRVGRFLYTQNPFYLISCFLIIYGLQIAAVARGDLFLRSIFLTAGLAGYTLLMTVTCIGVVRLGRVWQDARSILLVVIISLVALSTGLDEFCVTDWNLAAGLLACAALFSAAVSESILRVCRLRLPSWYRLSYYAILLVFFVAPVVLGFAVGDRQTRLTNWGGPIFSTLIAVALLLLIPALRRGQALVADNGTPWRYPLYPLSAFVILIVLAAIRTHAIWMSFGFMGAPVRFEPFLLLPIALAILILMVQSDSRQQPSTRTFAAMWSAPALWLCASTRGGMTNLPIRADLQRYFGSAETIALAAMLVLYLLVWRRRVKGSEFAVTATLVAMSVISDLPEAAQSLGFRHWMYLLAASAFSFVTCLRDIGSDRKWASFAAIGVVTILMAGRDYDQSTLSFIIAGVFAVAMMLTIGALFETDLAIALRQLAAASLVAAAVAIVVWHFTQAPGIRSYALLAGLSTVSLVYMQIVHRWGWLYVFGLQSACLVVLVGWTGYDAGAITGTNWPIPSGLVCFAIGLTITSMKTGIHQRLRRHLPRQPARIGYRSGL